MTWALVPRAFGAAPTEPRFVVKETMAMVRRTFGSGLAVWLLLAAATSVRAQQTPGSQVLFSFTGALPNAHLGTVVGSAGDADGDGRGDLIVGTDSLLTVVSGATGQPLYSIHADQPGDFERATAFSVPDVDGDARAEIVVAAPQADDIGLPDAGAVFLISGATGRRLWVSRGATAGARFGASAAVIGDLSGDGLPDLAVGAPGTHEFDLADAGSVAILSLADGTQLHHYRNTTAGERLGTAVAAVGDLDGDGRPDFAAGAPAASPQGVPNAGLVLLVSAADGRILDRIGGSDANSQLGASLAAAGDVDGDGRIDLFIGAPGRSVGNNPGVGTVSVWSTAGKRELFRLAGSAAGDGFGSVLAGGGDVDGDGRSDLLVGTPLADVAGQLDAGLVQVFSGADFHLLLSRAGAAGDQMGSAAAFVGDLNGDGRTDVAAGAPLANAAGMALVLAPGV
jgi:FG-GAP repeat